jgi:hypothetical protein
MVKKISGLFFLAALLLPASAKAENLAWTFSSAAQNASLTNDNFGVVFTPTVNIIVDELGYYDPTGGMQYSHAVGLYNSSGTLLATTTITSASTLTNNFLFNTLVTPIELFAGQTYVLDGYTGGYNADSVYGNDPVGVITAANVTADGFVVSAPITILGDNFVSGDSSLTDTGTSSYPFTSNYFGANRPASCCWEPDWLGWLA